MYHPISLEFFDQLEVAIEREIPSTVVYLKEHKQETVKDVVKTLAVEDYKEYLVLRSGEKIRLDLILSFNGKVHRKV